MREDVKMREEVKEFKRLRILEVAERLFYESGFEATSVDMVAGELGMTKPFVYSYFPNKRAILEAVYEQAAERILGFIDNAKEEGDPPEKRLRKFVEIFVHENIKNQVASGVYLQEEKHLSKETLERIRKIEQTFNRRLTNLIQEGVDARVFHVSDAKIASLCISGMVRWVHRWYHKKGRYSADEIAAQIAELALNTVGYAGK
jgi:AcrR family transcriptional regulator